MAKHRTHTGEIVAVTPSALGCEECLAIDLGGDTTPQNGPIPRYD